METITIKQVKSTIGQDKKQRATMEALGLRKINQTVTHRKTAAIQGMLARVKHLISIV